MEQEENVKTIAEYLEVVSRRKALILISFFTVGFLGFVLAMKLPPVYRSSATILIEDQQIPRSMVETTITDYADKRIQLIKQRVMTRDRILSIIQKYNVYLDERNKLVPSELVKRFQEDAEIQLIAADVLDPQRGGSKATIAFTIAFSDRNPLLAQSVANELVSLFLDENTRVRAQRAAKTTDFLNSEAEKLKAEIDAFDNRIMEYKAKHGNSLPEMLQTNLAAIDRTKIDLRQTDRDIRAAKDRIAYLMDSLSQAEQGISPLKNDHPLSKNEQLQLLKAQYIRLSSLYTAKHPDTLRVKRQIQNLDPDFTGEAGELEVGRALARAEEKLAELEKKYAANHPDVVKQRQVVANLSDKVAASADQGTAKIDTSQSDNPYYNNLAVQLRIAQNELEQLQQLKEDLQQNLQKIQADVDQTPLVEKEYLDLNRMRMASLNKYADLEAKYREAKLAQTLEEEQKGEAFTLIDPPIAPEKPEKPDKKKIIALGFGLGLGVGLALTLLLELMHEVIRGPKSLQRISGLAPLVVIPYIETLADKALQRRRVKRIQWLSGSAAMAAVLLVHFWVMPLPQIWAVGLAKLGRL